jgi:hypothetical protein
MFLKRMGFITVCAPVVAGLVFCSAETQARGRGGFGFGAAMGIVGAMGVIGAMRGGGIPVPRFHAGGGGGGGHYRHSRGHADTVSPVKPAKVQDVDQSINNLRLFEAYLRTFRQDRERNVEKAINSFIDVVASLTNAKVVRTANTNEITKQSVTAAVEAEYEKAGLAKFEQFGADLWTRERLTVEVIDRGTMMLEPYYAGVAQRGLSKEDLNTVFGKSAAQVYAVAMEAAELIGVEQSYDHLIHAIYENAPSNEDEAIKKAIDDAERNFDRLWKGANPVAATSFVQNRPAAQVAADNEADYGLSKRYRIKRVLLDCIAEGYETGFKLRPVGEAKETPVAFKDGGKKEAAPAGDLSGAKLSPGPSEGLIWTRLVAYSDYVCTPIIKELVSKFEGETFAPAPVKVASWSDFYANQGVSLTLTQVKK